MTPYDAFRSRAPGAWEVAGYLGHLGVTRRPPSLAALRELQAAHVERVPYETFWLHLGEQWGIAAADSFRRVAHRGRGGYCFHLNGALAELLAALGYRVELIAGAVLSPRQPVPAPDGHLLLVVGDLPTDDNPQGRWYVDAGLGDGPRHPLPLRPCSSDQDGVRWSMEPTTGPDGSGWRLGRPTGGSFDGVSFTERPVGIEAFAARHAFNRTSPESSFARTPTAQRRHALGTDVLRGLTLTRTTGRTSVTESFERQADWEAALADVFGLRPVVPRRAISALWARLADADEAAAAASAAPS
jgi:arylamine N-acetyltransferase